MLAQNKKNEKVVIEKNTPYIITRIVLSFIGAYPVFILQPFKKMQLKKQLVISKHSCLTGMTPLTPKRLEYIWEKIINFPDKFGGAASS